MKQFLKMLIWPIMLAPSIYLWLSWKNIPLTVPMHYNLKGEVDRYGSKTELVWLVIIMTIVSIATYLLLINTYRLDPKKGAAANRERMNRLAFGISLFMTALSIMMIYLSLNPPVEFHFNFILVAVGILFAFIGNYMHTIKPNYFAGIRLPWTLENEDNWRMTHALAGKLWFAGGIIIAIISLFASSQASLISMLVIVSIVVLIPAIYSYRIYKKQTSKTT